MNISYYQLDDEKMTRLVNLVKDKTLDALEKKGILTGGKCLELRKSIAIIYQKPTSFSILFRKIFKKKEDERELIYAVEILTIYNEED